MNERTLVILNAFANRCRAGEQRALLEQALDKAGVVHEIVSPLYPGHGGELAMTAAAKGCRAVVAAGGDGTVHEIVNGLMAASRGEMTIPLGILPLGTGNDFSDMAGIPRDIDEAARVIAEGKIEQVDVGRVVYATDAEIGGWQETFFNNNCAVAMEPLVTQETNRLKRIRGNLRYMIGLVRGFIKLKAWQMQITCDGAYFARPTYLFSVANSPRTGGQFLIAPEASITDGLFDFVFAPAMSRLEVLGILPGLLKGTHVRHPKVKTGRAREITVRSTPGTPVHADGEILASSSTVVHFQILPRKLQLFAP